MKKLLCACVIAGICLVLLGSGSEDLTVIGALGLSGAAFMLLGLRGLWDMEK